MKKKDCIFCNIEKDKLVKIIQRNSSFIAFLDIAPVSPGHAIIIPNNHIVSFFDFPESKSKELIIFLKDIKKILDKRFNPDAYNIGINDGRAAGRTRDHLHIHLIPRYDGDMANPTGGVRNILEKFVEPATPPKGFI